MPLGGGHAVAEQGRAGTLPIQTTESGRSSPSEGFAGGNHLQLADHVIGLRAELLVSTVRTTRSMRGDPARDEARPLLRDQVIGAMLDRVECSARRRPSAGSRSEAVGH
jgi:hypothetical protein